MPIYRRQKCHITDRQHRYNSFGQTVNYNSQTNNQIHSSPNQQLSISANPFQYDGYYYDSESGLYYLNARYYSPTLMQFISMDTYALANRYGYCNGNPIGNEDPTGHSAFAMSLIPGYGLYEAYKDLKNGNYLAGVLGGLIGAYFTWDSVGLIGAGVIKLGQKAITAYLKDEIEELDLEVKQVLPQKSNEEVAAVKIQNNFRNYLKKNKEIVLQGNKIIKRIGTKLENVNDISDDDVLVQLNGKEDNPTEGHSCFYKENGAKTYELTTRNEPNNSAFYSSKYSNKNGDYFNIYKARTDRPAQLSKLNYLIKKGSLYKLKNPFKSNFEDAFDKEVNYLKENDRIYGMNYNCNTFVVRILSLLENS